MLLANISLDLTCDLAVKDLIVDMIVIEMANDYISAQNYSMIPHSLPHSPAI